MNLESIPASRRQMVEELVDSMSKLDRELTDQELKELSDPADFLIELAVAVFHLEIGIDDISDELLMSE
jgi:hypothetical protein